MSGPADRRGRWLAAGLLLLFASLAWTGRKAGVDTGLDDAMYLELGRSLRQFRYHDVWDVAQPPHAMYPPVFPAALAVLGAVSGDSFQAAVILNIAALTLALAVVASAIARATHPAIALASLAALSVNPWLVFQAGAVYSEPLYILGSMSGLYLLGKGGRGSAAGAGAAAAIAALTRSIGATFALAVPLWLLLQRRWRAAMVAAALVGAAGLGWAAWVRYAHVNTEAITYADDAVAGTASGVGLVDRVAANARRYAERSFPSVLALPRIPGTGLDNVLLLGLFLGATTVGLVAAARRGHPAVVYLVSYTALLLYWPYPATRFLQPLVPLLVPLALAGAALIGKRIHRHGAAAAVTSLTLILFVGGLPRSFARAQRQLACRATPAGPLGSPASGCLDENERAFFAALDQLSRLMPAGDTLFTSKPAVVWYYTQRRSIPYRAYELPTDPVALIGALRRNGAGWILLAANDENDPGVMAPKLERACRLLTLVAQAEPHAMLLRPYPAADSGAAACAALGNYRRGHTTDLRTGLPRAYSVLGPGS